MNKLRSLRISRGLRQWELANILGVTEVAYSALEVGSNEMSASMLIAMAEFFGVSVDYIIGRSDSPHRSSDKSAEVYQYGEVFGSEDVKIISLYHNLDSESKEFVRAVLTHEVQRVHHANELACRLDELQNKTLPQIGV